MLSVPGIILSVIIITALAASAVFTLKAKFADNLHKPSFVYQRKTSLLRYLETKQISYFIFPVLLTLFFIQILLISPVLISGFYFEPFYRGILTAVLINSILMSGLIFLWKKGRLEILKSRFVILVIENIKNKFIKK